MRSFPNTIAKYIDTEFIALTSEEKLRIYSCFTEHSTDRAMNDFQKFTFRHGDKALLLGMAEYIKSVELSLFYFCNPNAEFKTISTNLGLFYVKGEDSTENRLAELNGKKLHTISRFKVQRTHFRCTEHAEK